MNDIHATILETFFFGYIDRNIGADETPLFTRTHEGEPLSDVIARRFQLTQDQAEAARQEVALWNATSTKRLPSASSSN